MPPAKPLPVVVPRDVDHLADDEMIAGDFGADRDHAASATTRNSASFSFGSTLAIGEMAALGLGDVLDLGLADAELERRCSRSFSWCDARRPDTSSSLQTPVTGTCVPSSLKTPGHAQLLWR
jgi:hypothetical protein